MELWQQPLAAGESTWPESLRLGEEEAEDFEAFSSSLIPVILSWERWAMLLRSVSGLYPAFLEVLKPLQILFPLLNPMVLYRE